ncbi:DUF5680 domain-containing protein [Candidatus Dojkabacteria bacterium]|jgi:hypothetical protein|nr:DUF5680 domain-containing protein [Candidatus Dojkabacteria bacterium]
MDLQKLKEFIFKASKATYASGSENIKIIESDKSTTLKYSEGEYSYHDNYFGGEPYGGREVVFINGNPVFMMTYYGKVVESITDLKTTYGFLQESLRQNTIESPLRGPKEYIKGDMKYTFELKGDIKEFIGFEKIFLNNEEIYTATFTGGLVDQRK